MLTIEEIKALLHHYKTSFIQEYKETIEWFFLIKKSFKQELNLEEKQKVKEQTIDILKVIPAFLIFMLPAGTLWLFLFFKLFPTLLPSSFQKKNNNN
ncbi:LETM1 domain-containing protein [uncultured Tenacibaculum sp.]|uniref:LETM1 domain-containing protein n=1 Tax=uncultured Tenacibaculum sp. TaxID=174713 RepID=UPI00262337CD|nr:LETM1 domain-containing protein [uncultured Tenacibaculum sp.]